MGRPNLVMKTLPISSPPISLLPASTSRGSSDDRPSMETNTTKIATSNQRNSPEPGAGDRLSSLPDEVLSHILSFLPTKYAAGTAVLSRRWKDVWTRVSNLDLDDSSVHHRHPRKNDGNVSQNMPREQIAEIQERRRSAFSRFVDRVVSQHRNLDSVRRFHLQVKSAALRYKFKLPESCYALKNLKVLKLYGVRIANAQGSVLLPNLNILQLFRVQPNDPESLRRLISDCPVLETVHIEKCYPSYSAQTVIIVSSQSLKNLTIIHREHASIAIEAPSVECLHLDLQFRSTVALRFLGGSTVFSCLDSAWVDIDWRENDPVRSQIELLNQISNARRVTLSYQTLGSISVVDGAQLPVFSNLTHLTMGAPGSRSLLHSLLNSASKLQSLVIDMGKINRKQLKWVSEPAYTPQCLLSSLEEVVIDNFAAELGADATLAAYLLKFGAVLKKVTVHLLFGLNTIDRRGLASLLKLARSSSACEVHFLLRNGDEVHIDINDEIGH